MKTKRMFLKMLSLVLVMLTVFSVSPLNAFATEGEEPSDGIPALVLTSDSLSVKERKTVQLTASVTNVETQPEIIWSSSDDSIATVDSNGKVKGVKVGRVIITAKAVVGETTLVGDFALNVVTRDNFIKFNFISYFFIQSL